MQWEFPEYETYERGPAWYVIMIGLGLIFFIYAIINGNFLFALILLLFALILFTYQRSTPMQIPFVIYETGVQIGDRFYLYREIESFSVVYEPPLVKTLYIVPRASVLKRDVSIPLDDHDPIQVRSLLLDHVEEDLTREEESSNDALRRLLKI